MALLLRTTSSSLSRSRHKVAGKRRPARSVATTMAIIRRSGSQNDIVSESLAFGAWISHFVADHFLATEALLLGRDLNTVDKNLRLYFICHGLQTASKIIFADI